MQLKDERRGKFWLPGPEPKRVPGILKVYAGRTEVELFGSFSKGFSSQSIGHYPKIFGDLHSEPRDGDKISLFDTFTSRLSRSMGTADLVAETLVASQAFVGYDHLPDKDVGLFEATVRISGLSRWVRERVFDTKVSRSEHSIRSRDRVRHEIDLPDAKVVVAAYSRIDVPGLESAQVSKVVDLVVRPQLPASNVHFQNNYILPLRNLFTLATNEFLAIQDIAYTLRDEHPWPPVVRTLGLRGEPEDVQRNYEDHLIPFAPSALQNMVSKWMAVSSREPRVLGLVFGLIEAPPRFAEVRFEMAAQAFELVARQIAHQKPCELAGSLSPAVELLLGKAVSLIDQVQLLRSRMWHTSEPLGAQLHWLTNAMMWLIKLRLAIAAGLELDGLLVTDVFREEATLIHERWAKSAAGE